MPNHTRRTLGLAAAFVLSAVAAQAQGHGKGKDKDHGRDKDRGARELRDDRDGRDGRDGRDDRDGRDGRDERGRYDGNVNGRRVPPGLAKKPGGMPPGQYKKHYSTQQGSSVLRDILLGRGYSVVRTENAGQSQYVYYRLRDGSVRRAVVSPGTDQLTFVNVPSALLREVLSRLY